MRIRQGPRGGADLVEVEIHDGEPDDGRPVDAGRPAAGTGPEAASGSEEAGYPPNGESDRHRRRGPSPRAVLAVVLVVAVVVTANVVEARRHARQLAQLAGLPGVVPSLEEPLRLVWERPGWLMGVPEDVLLVGDEHALVAVDPATGAELWSRPSETQDPAGIPENCWRVADQAPRALLACVRYVGYGPDVPDPFGPKEIPILDARTGERLHRLISAGEVISAEPLEQDLLVAQATETGALRVTRWDPVTSQKLWQVTTEAIAFRPGTGALDVLGWERDEHSLLVTGGAGSAAVDIVTGREISADGLRPEPPAEERALADGGTARWRWDAAGGSGEVRDADGSVRFELPGALQQPWVDDGAVPDVLIGSATDGELWAVDARTGAELWRVPFDNPNTLLQVDGIVLVSHLAGASALDMRDGRELWHSTASGVMATSVVTDGRTVLIAEGGDHSRLVARDLHDGTERWSLALPPLTHGVEAAEDGAVVVVTQTSVIGLG